MTCNSLHFSGAAVALFNFLQAESFGLDQSPVDEEDAAEEPENPRQTYGRFQVQESLGRGETQQVADGGHGSAGHAPGPGIQNTFNCEQAKKRSHTPLILSK